jgi:hypothetical protein
LGGDELELEVEVLRPKALKSGGGYVVDELCEETRALRGRGKKQIDD